MIDRRENGVSRALGVALLGALCATPMAAQNRDFRFDAPDLTLGVRLGFALPSADSEIFDQSIEELTLDRNDFNAFALGGELAVRLSERFDIALNAGASTSESRSEFREFIGEDDLPIEQDTRFTRVPVTLGVKAYLTERGRRISRFAWIPNRVAPYVGGGGGLVYYRFEQIGEFVDFETFEIFFSEFESSGAAPLAYVTAGVDVSLGKTWFVTGEGRYSWASAEMNRGFVGFDDIDLSGLNLALGISARL